jgi:prepilin-type N-terminal cleavage/methylation domain-containing protein
MNTYIKERREEGFTLIELLIAIVVVGILTAVVIVGIGGLVDNGSKGACRASMDAAKAATAVHKSNRGAYPFSFTGDGPDSFTAAELDTGEVAVTATTLKHGTDWTLTGVFSATGATAPTFSCNP